jgi:hypothetical protein
VSTWQQLQHVLIQVEERDVQQVCAVLLVSPRLLLLLVPEMCGVQLMQLPSVHH